MIVAFFVVMVGRSIVTGINVKASVVCRSHWTRGHDFWYNCPAELPPDDHIVHEYWIEEVGAKLLPRKPTFG